MWEGIQDICRKFASHIYTMMLSWYIVYNWVIDFDTNTSIKSSELKAVLRNPGHDNDARHVRHPFNRYFIISLIYGFVLKGKHCIYIWKMG